MRKKLMNPADFLHQVYTIEEGSEKFVNKIILSEHKKTISATNKKWASKVIPAAFILVPFAIKGAYNTVKDYKQKKANKIKNK